MKPFMSFLIKFLLLLLLAGLSWGISLYLYWPLWGSFAIFLGVLGFYFGVQLIHRIWIVSRSRTKLAQSEKAGRRAGGNSTAQLDLVGKWKSAISVLKRSSLKRFGNPMYVLPWYMVVGESGSGKTTAITRSRLTSMIKKISHTDPIAQTANCEWWFFNKAIVIDTAGRYVSPNSIESDQEEWEKLLDLLAKYRPKEGLDGLVVVIDSDRLLQNDSDLLEKRGIVLRERIDQLIRLFDKRFPIYVLVTKCDLIGGFNQWSQALSDVQLEQAMGYLGQEKQGDGAETNFLTEALDHIQERLRQLMLDMAVKGVDLTPEVLMFPAEVERLRAGLQSFLAASLGNNPYLEQPLLRGIFLSSGRQTGTAFPGLLSDMLGQSPAMLPSDKGIFLKDFFGRVLPQDRGLYMPTVIVNRWRQVTRNLALVCWLMFMAACMVFLLVSYAALKETLNDIQAAYPKQEIVSGTNAATTAQTLSAMRSVVDLILHNEVNWRTRWLAFSPAMTELEDDIKKNYVKGMKELLNPDTVYGQTVGTLLKDPQAPVYPFMMLGITRYYNKSQAGLNGVSYDDILNMAPVPRETLQAMDSLLRPDVIDAFDRMISAYFAWSVNHDPAIQKSSEVALRILSDGVFMPGQMPWLLNWADEQSDIKPVTLSEFWVPGSIGNGGLQVRPAFTQAGKARINSFLDELQQAFNNSPQFIAKRRAFEIWYRSERIHAWFNFATAFGSGSKLLVSEPAWRGMVQRVNKESSPFYMLIARLSDEFADLPKSELHDWLIFAREFTALRKNASETGLLKRTESMIGVINSIGGKAIQDAIDAKSLQVLTSTFKGSISATDTFVKYSTDFDAIASDVITGEGVAYQLASDFFAYGVNPSVKTSALSGLQDVFESYRNASGFNRLDEQVMWQLVSGPLDLLIRYVIEQASCGVQKDWEKSVLWRTQTAVTTREVNEQLFGAKGSVWTFAESTAKPFIQQSASQFLPMKAGNYLFPFTGDFFLFLNQSITMRVDQLVKNLRAEGSKGKTVKVSFSSRPLSVNPEAKVKPYAALLSIQCANEEITLNNFNIESSDSLTWSPDFCGDVTLQVKIDNLTLTRRYPGSLGLARFIEEFQDGERIFTPLDFPSVKEQLDAQNVKTISVRYDMAGHEALLKLAEDFDYISQITTPSASASVTGKRLVSLPERIGQCWAVSNLLQTPAPDISKMIEQRALSFSTESNTQSVPSQQTVALKPQPESVVVKTPVSKDSSSKTLRYVIESGDTLTSIARKFQTDVKTLLRLNNFVNDTIQTGRVLLVPTN